jgi:L-threonylcarbamoyladenylate synthase
MSVGLTTRMIAASPAAVAEAARCLKEGGLVAFPTETVYGLGADAGNAEAIARLYRAKGRPSFNPLIATVADLEAARLIGRFGAQALALAEAFWPGPLTLVLPKAALCVVADLATAGLDTIAIRVPSHPVARQLLRAFGGAVVAPSANLSGHVSPTTALLRPGGLPRGEIERLLGSALVQPPDDPTPASGQPLAPGMLASHYAPRTPVRLDAVSLKPGEALLAFGPGSVEGIDAARAVMNLSEHGDLTEAAACLFGHLRALDALRADTIAVMPVPHHGLGEAINDRLRRAAVPQD